MDIVLGMYVCAATTHRAHYWQARVGRNGINGISDITGARIRILDKHDGCFQVQLCGFLSQVLHAKSMISNIMEKTTHSEKEKDSFVETPSGNASSSTPQPILDAPLSQAGEISQKESDCTDPHAEELNATSSPEVLDAGPEIIEVSAERESIHGVDECNVVKTAPTENHLCDGGKGEGNGTCRVDGCGNVHDLHHSGHDNDDDHDDDHDADDALVAKDGGSSCSRESSSQKSDSSTDSSVKSVKEVHPQRCHGVDCGGTCSQESSSQKSDSSTDSSVKSVKKVKQPRHHEVVIDPDDL